MFNEGIILGFLTAVFWGISPLIYRLGGKDLSPFEINFIRNVGAFLSVLLINLLTKSLDQLIVVLPLKYWLLFFLSLVSGLFIGDNLFFKGINLIGVSKSTVISASYPIVTILLAFAFLNERISSSLLIASLAIIVGIYLLYEGRDASNVAKPSLAGYLASLGAALAWGLSLALVKVVSPCFTPISFMTWRVTILLVVTLSFVLVKRNGLSREFRNPKKWLILGIGGTIGIGVSYLTFIRAIQLAPVSQIGLITGTSPLLTALLAAVFYGEKLGSRGMIGSLLVIGGGILASI